jgi:hypothetical protein
MELNNCLICLCHKDNKKYNKCSGKRHIYKINQKQADKWNWTINYIKKELETGRDLSSIWISSSLTSFPPKPSNLTDIEIFENYCFNFDRDFYKILKTYNN